MKTVKILLCLAGILICASFAGTAFTGTDTTQSPPPFHRMGLTGITGDQQYLYVMAGGKILEYDMSVMSLVKSVALPDPGTPPTPPPPSDTTKADFNKFPPPMGAPHGLWANDHYLYVLAGPKLYRYSTPDLTLQLTQDLPKPEPPANAK